MISIDTIGSKTAEYVWAKVELMGRVMYAGRLSEVERYGGKLGRIDVPDGDGFTTHYFGASAVYLITFVSEQVARDLAAANKNQPIQSWDYPSEIKEMMQRARLPKYDDKDDEVIDKRCEEDRDPEFDRTDERGEPF